MLNFLRRRRFALTVVISSFLVFAENTIFYEHADFIQIPPYDQAFYYLRVSSPNRHPLIIWLGHSPDHPINYNEKNPAIPSFPNNANINLLMIDLPGVGKTKSSRRISLESLINFLRTATVYIKNRHSNFTFSEIWVGGEKFMTPLAVYLADALTGIKENVKGLILGNPYLEGRLSIPRRFQIVKHFGFLDIEKEDQFKFLNYLCMQNTSLEGCSRIDKLFDIVTNKSDHFPTWSQNYIKSILNKSNYLANFIGLLESKRYKFLLYTGQLDLNTGFRRVYSFLQHFNVCETPSNYTYYLTEDSSVKGFYRQNSCWTLLQIYNSSSNLTSTIGDLMAHIFEEFTKYQQLKCDKLELCDMERQIRKNTSNCIVTDWTSEQYLCKCDNGKYGISCNINVLNSTYNENYIDYLSENEVKYIKYTTKGKGKLLLKNNKQDCNIEIYANFYYENADYLEVPNNDKHNFHTRKGKIYIPANSNGQEKTLMLKVFSKCPGIAEFSLEFQKEKLVDTTIYWILISGMLCLIIGMIIVICLVQRKLCKKNEDYNNISNSLLKESEKNTI